MGEKGWRFVTPDENVPGENVTAEPLNGYSHLREIYFSVDPEYKGRFTVPTLYDKKTKQIVSNEVRPSLFPEVRVPLLTLGIELGDNSHVLS